MLSTNMSSDSLCTNYSDDADWDRFDSVIAVKEPINRKCCVSCNSTNIVSEHSRGHMLCNNCGTCFGQIIDNGIDWSTGDDSNEIARCGFVTSHFFPKSSMRTSTACGRNPSLKLIGRNDQMPYEEFSLLKIFDIISNRCKANNLSDAVIQNTKIIYFEIHKRHIIIRGHKNKHGMYGACTFCGAQIQHSYRSIEEIAKIFQITETDVTNSLNKLQKYLIGHPLLNSLTPTSPLDFIDRYCYILNFNREQIQVIRRIAANNTKLYLTSNHQPMSIATSCVLLYMDMFGIQVPTKKQVLKTFNVTAVTADKIFAKMKPFRNVIIDDQITDMTFKAFQDSKFIAVRADLQESLDRETNKIRDELYEQNKEILRLEGLHSDSLNEDSSSDAPVQDICNKIKELSMVKIPKYKITKST